MNKLIAGLCGLMLAVTPFALAQGASAAKKPVPMTQKQRAAQEKAIQGKMAQCAAQAQGKKLAAGTPAFNQFISGCLNG